MDLVAVALGLGVGLILGVIGVGGVMMTIPLLMIGVDFNIAQASTGHCRGPWGHARFVDCSAVS